MEAWNIYVLVMQNAKPHRLTLINEGITTQPITVNSISFCQFMEIFQFLSIFRQGVVACHIWLAIAKLGLDVGWWNLY